MVDIGLVSFIHDCGFFLLQNASPLDQIWSSHLEKVHLLEVLSDWVKLVEIEENHMLSCISCGERLRVCFEEALNEGDGRDFSGDYRIFITVQAEHVKRVKLAKFCQNTVITIHRRRKFEWVLTPEPIWEDKLVRFTTCEMASQLMQLLLWQ